MRMERSKSAVMLEAGMFAAMAAAVGMVAFMVVGGASFVAGLLAGGAVFVVVFAVMWIMTGATMEPPRGPGNIKQTETPLTRSQAPAQAEKPAAKKAAPKPATAKVDPKPAPKPAPAAKPAEEMAPAEAGKPALLKAPRADGADDLKKIKGVGPKLEKVLNDTGVYHFDQIAAWSADEVAWADENLVGFKGRVSRDDWVSQAKALASGQSAEGGA